MRKVVTAILGGGAGSRLWPLTRHRAKPAVPIGGKYRLIDIPISNSLHGGIEKIYVLTQFNSESLHRHITQTYRFDSFSEGYVNILAAEQTIGDMSWYEGTADAVRKNLRRLCYSLPDEVCILSGDQLYLMDLDKFVQRHRESKADITIAVKPMPRADSKALGIMRLDPQDGEIVEFVEKPQEDEELDRLTPSRESLQKLGIEPKPDHLLASMGIYIFKREVLVEILEGSNDQDFGREVIPQALGEHRVYAFNYDGYWADIGTVGTFFEANLAFTWPVPPLNLYDKQRPVYTHPRFLPPTKVHSCDLRHVVFSEGAVLLDSHIEKSIIGLRSVIRKGSTIQETYMMGATEFAPTDADATVPRGIGENCEIRRAILDVNVRIGDGSKLINENGLREAEGPGWVIKEGVIVVEKDAEIPAGTVI